MNPSASQGQPTNHTIHLSYCERLQKNKPQSNAVSPGALIMMISGMHIGWSTWGVIYYAGTEETIGFMILSGWYIGAIIGSVVGAFLVTLIQKKITYIVGSIILLISGLILVIEPHVFGTVLTGRMFAGLCHGIIYASSVTHAAEVAATEMRGHILTSFGYMICVGICLTTLLFGMNASGALIIGIISIINAVLAILVTYFYAYESPAFLIRTGNEADALNAMVKLRSGSEVTHSIRQDFQEVKEMVDDEKSQSSNSLFSNGNIRPLGFMICARLLWILSSNALINVIIWVFTIYLIGDLAIAIIALTAIRAVTCTIPMFTIYFVGRKVHLLASGMVAAVSLLVFAIILTTNLQIFLVPGLLAMLFQSSAGIGIDVIPHVLLGEAFAGPKNAVSITFVCILEYVLQIVFIRLAQLFLIVTTPGSIYAMTFISAGGLAFLTLVLHLMLPETRSMSLRVAKNIFSRRYIAGNVYVNKNMQGITYS